MRIHGLVNDPAAGLSLIEDWATAKGHYTSITKVYNGEKFPDMKDFDMLVILGGEAGAYDEDKYPWLIKEKEYILQTIQANKSVLGICLGSQMIAEVLGGSVNPNVHAEIGWWELDFKDNYDSHPLLNGLPKKITPFQFHGDTFDLPDNIINLASSQASKNQVFTYGDRVLGLQFHPEFTKDQLQKIIDSKRFTIKKGIYTQLPEYFLACDENFQNMKTYLFKLLDNFEKITVNR